MLSIILTLGVKLYLMDIHLFEQLYQAGFLKRDALEKIKVQESRKLVPIGKELKTILSLGILLFSSGLGILVYKNIDTIGHAVIISLIGILMMVCFVYCYKKAASFSLLRVTSPNLWFDYILVLGSLLMLTFIGYIQYQYHLFGTSWNLAAFVPVLFLFGFAYYFDNIVVLGMAITNFGAWVGISVSPANILSANDFSNDNVIYSGIALGVLFQLLSYYSLVRDIKAHFAYTYKNFGIHLLFISLLAGMFHFDGFYLVFFLVLAAVFVFQYFQSIRERSYYFLLFTLIYGYIGLSYLVVRMFANVDLWGILFYYFIFSGFGLLYWLRQLHLMFTLKTPKNDSIQ